MSTEGPWYGETQIPSDYAPSIVALGDSWFWYPVNNLANPLQKIVNRSFAQPILVLGANGAEAEEFLGEHYRRQLQRLLDPRRGYGRTVRAVFLSGGGNDVAGTDDFPSLLRDDCGSAQGTEECFLPGEPARTADRLTNFLLQVHDLVQSILPGTPVIVHGYDYAIPNGKGFLGLGQWLREPMDSRHVPRRLQRAVVRELIDELARSQGDAMHPTFLAVDTRGTLSVDEWANELHPTPNGFNRIARGWREPLRQLGLVS